MDNYIIGDMEEQEIQKMKENKLSWKEKRELNKSIKKDEKILDANWKFAKKVIFPAIEQVSTTDTETLKNIIYAIDKKNLLDFHCFPINHINTLYSKLCKNNEMKNNKMTEILGSIINAYENSEKSF